MKSDTRIVHARGSEITAKVGARVAAVAVLSLELGARPRACHGVSDKHAEALCGVLSVKSVMCKVMVIKRGARSKMTNEPA